ncbi:MAG: hypothetical protein AAGB48_10125 [Planctomycetota bacterium]
MGAGKPKPWAIIALAVAGSALAFDQFILTASAGETAVAVQASPLDSPVSAGASRSDQTDTSGNRRTLHQIMASYAPDENIAPSSDSMFDLPGTLTAPSEPTGRAEREPPKLGYRLSSVIERSGRRMAVINGTLVVVGDTVAGARVKAIHERSVLLTTDIGPLTLRIERPNLNN